MNVVDSSGWLEYFVNGPGAVHGAIVWTQDTDFEGLDDVKFFPKQK